MQETPDDSVNPTYSTALFFLVACRQFFSYIFGRTRIRTLTLLPAVLPVTLRISMDANEE